MDRQPNHTGQRILVLSGPSGSGKTTLIRRLMMTVPGLRFAVSHTTRERRTGETPGEDYHFVSEAEFRSMIKADAFVEWAQVHGRLYGTSWAELSPRGPEDGTLILDVDIQGAEAIRRRLPDSMCVFIMPPSIPELRQRLLRRESRLTPALEQRLETALREMSTFRDFQFTLINDVLDNALESLIHIVRAMEHRTLRQEERVERILGGRT